MFLNPWYSGQPTVGSQQADASNNGEIGSQNFSSPEEALNTNYPSDAGQDFLHEKVSLFTKSK